MTALVVFFARRDSSSLRYAIKEILRLLRVPLTAGGRERQIRMDRTIRVRPSDRGLHGVDRFGNRVFCGARREEHPDRQLGGWNQTFTGYVPGCRYVWAMRRSVTTPPQAVSSPSPNSTRVRPNAGAFPSP